MPLQQVPGAGAERRVSVSGLCLQLGEGNTCEICVRMKHGSGYIHYMLAMVFYRNV